MKKMKMDYRKMDEIMKNSIISTGGKFSTARMLVDYTE